MYDLTFFRNNLDAIAKRLADRGFTLDVEAFRKLDVERRAALSESESLKARRNAETQVSGNRKVVKWPIAWLPWMKKPKRWIPNFVNFWPEFPILLTNPSPPAEVR